MWPRVITEVGYDELGNLQIGGIDDNERPWHESVTGRGQEAWLLKQLYVERRFGRRNKKYSVRKNSRASRRNFGSRLGAGLPGGGYLQEVPVPPGGLQVCESVRRILEADNVLGFLCFLCYYEAGGDRMALESTNILVRSRRLAQDLRREGRMEDAAVVEQLVQNLEQQAARATYATTGEIARQLGVSRQTVVNWIKRGFLPGVKLGGGSSCRQQSWRAWKKWPGS